MSLEGQFRDLRLAEVLQLLGNGSRTGTLHCAAPLLGRWIKVGIDAGLIVRVWSGSLGNPINSHTGVMSANEDVDGKLSLNQRSGREALLEALRWTQGTFHFEANREIAGTQRIRISLDQLLMDGAVQAAIWADIEARVPHPRVIPVFATIGPRELPELKLSPLQWEVLAQVDGCRTVSELASGLEKETCEIAQAVHCLIEIGLVSLREGAGIRRQNPTPPASHIAVPSECERSAGNIRSEWEVAGSALQPSYSCTESVRTRGQLDISALRESGCELVRQGELAKAVVLWTEALGAARTAEEAEKLSQMIDLASRLLALVLE